MIQLPFHRGWTLLMELARSQRSDAGFPIALRSRCDQMAELSLRASLLCLASLLLAKYPLLRRDYLEKPFHVVSHCGPRAELSLPWRADLAICLAKLLFQAMAIWLREATKLSPVNWYQPAERSSPPWFPRLLSWCRLWS